METQIPEITVLMPVYQAAKFVNEAVQSILQQTFTNFELLILEGGSTDDTLAIIKAIQDPRIRLIHYDPRPTLVEKLNRGLEMAQGQFIARMDADDIAHPERLAKQYTFMMAHPEIQILGTGFSHLGGSYEGNAHTYPASHHEIRAQMLFTCPMAHPTVLLRRSFIQQHQLCYSPDYPYAEDYALWVWASQAGQLANLPEPLLQYRTHGAQSSANVKTQQHSVAKIHHEQLITLGLQPTPLEIKLHEQLSLKQFEPTQDFLVQTSQWLSKIFRANQQSKFLNESALAQLLLDFWLKMLQTHKKQYFNLKTWSLYQQLSFRKAGIRKSTTSSTLFWKCLTYDFKNILLGLHRGF